MRAAEPGRRRIITLEVDGSIFVLRGYAAHGKAIAAGLRPTYSGVRQGWVADTKRLPDLVAYMQYRNVAFEVVDLAGVATATTESDDSVGDPATDVPLFDAGGGDAA